MRLLAATLFLNEPKLIAYVEDGGKRRRVVVTWAVAGPEASLLPTTWAESVRGEVEYQRSLESSPLGAMSRLPR